mgnify:CR=1 FL=1
MLALCTAAIGGGGKLLHGSCFKSAIRPGFCLSLIRSKLFWKIVGLYVLLSVPAIVGLVAALQTRMHSNAISMHEQQVQDFLRETIQRLQQQSDPATAGDELQRIRMGLTGGRRIWLTDSRGHDSRGLPQTDLKGSKFAFEINDLFLGKNQTKNFPEKIYLSWQSAWKSNQIGRAHV